MKVEGPASPKELVALADCCAEARLGGALLERVALGGVARDAVEGRPEDLGRMQSLRVQRLVHQQLHHHQLVDRVARDALDQDLGRLVELGRRRRLDRKLPLDRLGARERVARERAMRQTASEAIASVDGSGLGARASSLRRAMVSIVAAYSLAMSTSIAGHAMATEPNGLRVPLDMLHVLAAAAWVGGLLALYHYCTTDHVQAPAVVRYSRLALGCVVVLIATGTFAARSSKATSRCARSSTPPTKSCR